MKIPALTELAMQERQTSGRKCPILHVVRFDYYHIKMWIFNKNLGISRRSGPGLRRFGYQMVAQDPGFLCGHNMLWVNLTILIAVFL